MAYQVTMPQMGYDMTEGSINNWVVKEGDRVERGDVIASIATEKADIDIEAYASGVLRKILVQPGAKVPVGMAIAVIGDPDEQLPAAEATEPPKGEGADAPAPVEAAAAAPAASPAAAGEAQGEPSANGARAREEAATGTRGLESAPSPWAEFKGGQDRGAEPGGSRVKASPLARRRARELGVELAALHASGPGGRIRAEDVEAATRQGTARSPARAAGPGPVPDAEDPGRPLELTRMREAIARRMAESNSTIPHFHLSTEVDMGDLLQLRGQLNELGEAGLPRFSVTDFLVRALALTLQQHRELNAAWMGQGVRQFNQSNIALAVALPGGLVAPVLRACESRSFSELARRTHDLVARAKEGKLRPEELSGGHAAISNLGMFGVSRFNAIISPGHGSVLAVGEVRPEAVVREGQLTVGRRMSLTLGIDHRVTDGAVAAEALAYLRWLLEHPSRCLL